MSVLIMGYGEMGQAMEFLLAPAHRVTHWERRHPLDLAAATRDAQAVLLCVPAPALADVVRLVSPHLRADLPLASIAKGLDDQGRYAAQILAAECPANQAWAVIYGPMIAEEMRAGRPGFAQVAATTAAAQARIRTLFAGSGLLLEDATDIAGMSWCAALKNVYTLLIGAAEALDLGDNTRGFLVTQSLRELAAIVEHQGGSAATILQLAGVGDFITTATSAGSHHHVLGQRLARGDATEIRGEGVHTLAMLEKHGLLKHGSYPLLQTATAFLHTPAQARRLFEDYLQRVFDA
ncbi:MAG: hypothetical protein OEW08_05715 [Gammaproteobacteria bacterium]|nr:hypothetical protein [Gammaproteobacteria bacterium]